MAVSSFADLGRRKLHDLFERLLLVLSVTAMVCALQSGCSASDTASDCGETTTGETTTPPITVPCWAPAGDLIIYYLVPLVRIEFPDGPTCPGRQVLDYKREGLFSYSLIGRSATRMQKLGMVDPSWSPAGDEIAFEFDGDIYKMGFDGAVFDTLNAVKLTYDSINFDPAWSPDGLGITFDHRNCPGPPSSDSLSCGIMLMAPDGSGKHRVASGLSSWWMSDSESLVHVGLWGDLYKTHLGDSTVSRLTHFNSKGNYPRFVYEVAVSPDGEWVAFSSQPNGGNNDIWMLRPDGGGLRRVTNEGTTNRFYWAPDSKQIAYVSFRYNDWSEENGSLYIINIDTGKRTRLTGGTMK